jgi:uncharacterized protein (DUF2062 family)
MISKAEEPAGLTKPGFLRRWLVLPVVEQLTCGATPERLAWTISVGLMVGIFPIMGTTTVLGVLFGWLLRLNQAVLHVFRVFVYPLHLALILVFIRMGQQLFGSPPIGFSIPQLLVRFKESPLQFAKDFGLAAGEGVVAWLLVAPVAALVIKMAVQPLLSRLAMKIKSQREVLP